MPTRILLVEDDAAVRRALQLLLTSEGYEVRSYSSGVGLERDKVALESACLVADMVMPDVGALDLLRNLRDASWPGTAILVSGFLSSESRERAFAAGFDRVLDKPIREAALVDEIATLLSKQSFDSGKGQKS